MAELAPDNVRPRRDIQDCLREFLMTRPFIGLKLFPLFPVDQKTGYYPMIPTESMLKLPESIERAPKAAYGRIDWNWTTDNYACKEYGVEQPVDEVQAAETESFFDLEEEAGRTVSDIVLRMQEQRILTMCQVAANWGNTGAVAAAWDVPAAAVPITDIHAARLVIRAATGLLPDTLVVGRDTFQWFTLCDQITDRIQYTYPGMDRGDYTAELIAKMLGLRQVLIADAVYDTTDEGQASTIDDMWDDDFAFLCKVAENPSRLREPCIGRTFLWERDSAENLVFESYAEPQTRSEIVRARHHTDEEIVLANCGYLFTGCNT